MKLDPEDDSTVRLLRIAIVVLLVVGAIAFVTEGADSPRDPVLAAGDCEGTASLGDHSFGQTLIRISGAGTETTECALVADSPERRGRGLMEVEDLGRHVGMVFVFDNDTTSRFYMRNTPMPLSIAWFDAAGLFVSATDMEPCEQELSCPLYGATGPYRYALEVPKGKLPALGVGDGARLELQSMASKR